MSGSAVIIVFRVEGDVFMKEQIMQRLGAVLNALNSISVSGKSNLANLSGSIAVIEEVHTMLMDFDIMPAQQEQAGSNG